MFCIPGGERYNLGGNKTRADHVGPVNVICRVLITTWRLCEAVCAGSQLSRQRRPDLLPKQHWLEPWRQPWKRDFLSVGDPVWMARFKQIKDRVRCCVCVTLCPVGREGHSQRPCVVYCHSWRGNGLCVYHTQPLMDDTEWKCPLNCLVAHPAMGSWGHSLLSQFLIIYIHQQSAIWSRRAFKAALCAHSGSQEMKPPPSLCRVLIQC